jgi:G:T-mismatch repair DNA endonuclease (very short patch repair protein)
LIEIWGDYWHKNQNPEDVINHYKKYGFDCLVVWEHELKNLADVKEKVVQFTFARENLYEKS